MTSPPGGEQAALPRRAANAPITRKLARRFPTSDVGGESLVRSAALMRRPCSEVASTTAPRLRSTSAMWPTSPIAGTFSRQQSSVTSSDAAMAPMVAFLEPLTATTPSRGRPPSTTSVVVSWLLVTIRGAVCSLTATPR